MDKVIVGVDGSLASRAAVRWAAREAQAHGVPLVAIEAWEFSPLVFAADVPVQIDDLRSTVTTHLEETVADVLGDDFADVSVERKIVEEAPVPALLGEAGPDDVIVVGSRGRGGFSGLLLGSVSQQLAQHAPCPVVIVRATHED
ncbi:MAG: universal stress protein [Acidimicrobiia bacterium]|nr:universal stress protein [Acidimicrobiia bacterium]